MSSDLPVDDALSYALVRLADGDRSAFDHVYATIAPKVDRVCARILGPGADAEDAAQQALMKILVQCENYDPARGTALGWAMSVAIWEARTIKRKRGRRREDPLPTHPVAVASPTPEEHALQADLLCLIEEGMAQLQPLDRQTLQAQLTEHRPDIPAATFRKRLQRAMLRLKTVLWNSP
ncbi:MAG: sigma-70 family RNA polymerase sigma factor [Myxococcales bacterium]|nr:sigma-70 family RNA polymerase sigma factor [Myxococcales bacterium]